MPSTVRVFAAVCVLALAACGKPAASAPAPAKPPVPVEVAVAVVRDVPLRQRAVGTVAASESVVVRPQVTAALTAVRFTEGDSVAAGAPLFELDDRPFAAAVRQVEAELERAQAGERQARAVLERDRAQLALAESELRRTEELVRQQMTSVQLADQARAAVLGARATIAADEAAIATALAAAHAAEAALSKARLDLAWCRIGAPIAGRTGTLGVTVGNLTSAGQTALVTIVRTQPIHVGFALPADTLAAIRTAQAKGPLTVSVLPSGGAAAEPGTLGLIDNQIDQSTATVHLRAVCPNPQDSLWPGQQCQVDLILGVEGGRVTVPAKAIQSGQDGTLAWVVAADRTVAPRPVTVARVVDGLAVVAAGLAAGDTVVVDGHIRLVRGAMVAVPATASGAAQR